MNPGINRRRFLGQAAGMAAGAAAAPVLSADPAFADGRGPADLIVYNGRVQVMDRRLRRAEEAATRNGIVMAVGRERDIRRLAGRRKPSPATAGAMAPAAVKWRNARGAACLQRGACCCKRA